MSLGILNNLSAMMAENNLNATSNSLQTVLQELASGSKINSGADDAAGLSLVNGLAANERALAQSQTNVAEGVGLLRVADGALTQVTNLLNRAVTLATEASNGTLNSSQDAAANQEYQSILSEVTNIGSTTDFNQQQVFHSNTDIYTGDSSTQGASIDDLNIRGLSSASLGDTGGAMTYGGGSQGSVFVNLSTSATVAQAGDSFGSATTTVDVNYLVNGSGNTATKAISVGSGTNYSDTAQGLIKAIDSSGLGLSASFTTAAVAGPAAVGEAEGANGVTAAQANAEGGIEITGSVAAAGVAPNAASSSGALDASGLTPGATLATGASVTAQVGNGQARTFTVSSDNTLSALAGVIGAAAFGVTATLITNKDGTQSLGLADSVAGAGALTVSTAAGSGSGAQLSYSAASPYSMGLSGDAADAVYDINTGQTSGATAIFTTGAMAQSGAATMSYSDAAGQSLSGTDLLTQGDSQSTLTDLNAAITDVAAQDGYVGAQINTLTAVGQVLGTQLENVTAAQNAVQATDYATATSALAKYEILMQTGISALAQANSTMQEVTKLLQ